MNKTLTDIKKSFNSDSQTDKYLNIIMEKAEAAGLDDRNILAALQKFIDLCGHADKQAAFCNVCTLIDEASKKIINSASQQNLSQESNASIMGEAIERGIQHSLNENNESIKQILSKPIKSRIERFNKLVSKLSAAIVGKNFKGEAIDETIDKDNEEIQSAMKEASHIEAIINKKEKTFQESLASAKEHNPIVLLIR